MRAAFLSGVIVGFLACSAGATMLMDEAGNFCKHGPGVEEVFVGTKSTPGSLPTTPLWQVLVDTTGSLTRLYVCAGLAFASQHGGVYVSDSDGVTWDSLSASFSNDFVLSLGMDVNNTDILLAGTDGDGIYRTTDAGANWEGVLAAQKTRHLIFDESNPDVVYSGNEGTGVFKSTDGGGTWVSSNAGMGLVNAVGAAVDGADSGHIYVIWQALNSGGVFLTSDGGSTWTPAPNLPSQRQTGIALDPTDGNVLYVCNSGPWNAGMDDGVYKSTDGGLTWSTNWSFSDTAELHSVAVAPSNPSIVFAGGNKWLQPFGSRIWKSTDAGMSWSLIYDNPDKQFVGICTIVVDPLDTLLAYAGAAANGSTVIGVLKTTDGGTTWNESNTGLTDLNIRSLAIDPSDNSRIAAATAGGVFVSTDFGDSWVATDSIGYTQSITVRPDSLTYAGTNSGGVYRSTDFGSTWLPFNDGMTVLRPVNHLTFDPSNPHRVLAALSNVGVYAVVDTGSGTWHAIGPYGGDVNHIEVVRSDNQKLYAATQSGVFKSDDGGAYWDKCPGSPAGEINVVRSSWSGDTIFAGASSYYWSVDAGSTWSEIPLPTAPYSGVDAISTDPYDSSIMYLGIGSYLSGSYCHVLKSTDGGTTWELKCGGLPFSNTMAVSSIGINAMNTLKLYATFGSGFFGTSDFYVSLDGGESWTHPVGAEEADRLLPEGNLDIRVSPNPFRDRTSIFMVGEIGLLRSSKTELRVYNSSGRLISTLDCGEDDEFSAMWDGGSRDGGESPSGVYFLKLSSGNRTVTKKAVLVR